MNRDQKQLLFLWSALALVVLIGFLWQWIPLEDGSFRMKNLPLYGHHFIGKNLDLSTFEKDYFADVAVIKRMYRSKTAMYFITVLDGTNNRHVVHDPMYCFRGNGLTVFKKKTLYLKQGSIEKIFLKNSEDQKQEALYWFSDHSRVFSSPMLYWVYATLRRLSFGYSGKEPLLIMIQSLSSNELNEKEILELFPELLTI